jgi:hypothetical protein
MDAYHVQNEVEPYCGFWPYPSAPPPHRPPKPSSKLRWQALRFPDEGMNESKRGHLVENPPPVWLYFSVHMEVAEVLSQKWELETVDYIIVSTKSSYMKRDQTNIDVERRSYPP